MPPLATILPPSPFPYQFTELVAFRGDFDSLTRAGEPVNPKGLAYHPALDRLIVSLSPFPGQPHDRLQILNAVARDGARGLFSPDYRPFRGVEAKLVVVPASGPPVEQAGFTPGDIFVAMGPSTELSRLSATGEVLEEIWMYFGPGGGLWGGLAFDTEGDFGGQLLVVGAEGKIFLVDGQTQLTELKDLQLRLEGAAVAPATFGPLAKQLIVGVEGYGDGDPNGGKIYAVNAAGAETLLADIGYAAESLSFIPPRSGTYYQAELCFDRERENRIVTVSSSQFLNRTGRLIVVNEITGELTEVAWNGEQYTQEPVGRVPGRWSTEGFQIQGTELEAGCFAAREPEIPDWNNWQTVPGGFRTGNAPAASADAFGNVALFTRNPTTRGIFVNRLDGDGWKGWHESRNRFITPYSPACELHNRQLYAFAVRTDGAIGYKPAEELEDDGADWSFVPGNLLAGAAVCTAVINGRLVLSALGRDGQIYLNELAPGARSWQGWQMIPGGGRTNVSPCVASFQDELYVFIKGNTSQRILVKTRSVDGVWTPWAELPGAGRTDTALTAVSCRGQLYVFMKALDGTPWVNVASATGVWSTWLRLPNPGLTDTALAPAVVNDRVYLFAKGIDDRQVYLRSTL